MDKDKSTDFHREEEIRICENKNFKLCLKNRVSSYIPNGPGKISLPVMGQLRRRLYTGDLYVQSMREGRAGNSSALLYTGGMLG